METSLETPIIAPSLSLGSADEPLRPTPLLFGGSGTQDLTHEVCDYLRVDAGRLSIQKFADGEIFVKINENVRGREVFIVLSTCPPVNDNILELCLITDALRRASAFRICAVLPYYGYARQDRKEQGRVALSAKLVANLIVTAGVDRVLTVDLHAGQIQGFFDIPVDHLQATPLLVDYVRRNFDFTADNAVVVSPDVGNVRRSREYAERLNLPLAIIDKRRPRPNVSEVMNVIGEVGGKHAIIFDDMIDTAGTLCNAAKAVAAEGATSIHALATHALFSGPALERIGAAPIDSVVVTNTIPARVEHPKVVTVSVAPLLGEAIKRIFYRQSVSSLFQ